MPTFIEQHLDLLRNRELKHATFLSHERKPEVNISPAWTVVSPDFQTNRLYKWKDTSDINAVVWIQVKYENSTLPVAVRGSETLRA